MAGAGLGALEPCVVESVQLMSSRLRLLRSGLEHHDPSNPMPVFLSTLKKPWQSAKGHQMSSQHAPAEASTASPALSLPTNLSLWTETTISSFQVKS